MNPSSSHPPQSISDLIAQYLQALEKGESPDRQSLLSAHPQWAEELQAFFVDHDRMKQLVESPTIVPDVFEAPTGPLLGDPPSPGTKIRYLGDYELLEEIARGGMGIVYRARQISLNRTVALKMILAGQLASQEDVQRFRTEAEAAANLDHPHIVPIYEVGEHEGQHYFSMKLIEGGSLSQEKDKRQKSVGSKAHQRWAAQLVATVARAVHHAHQRGILHRDLKPGNILVDSQGQPHVTDFGLAKKVEGGSEMTHTGVIVGTPSYMAPEQARSNKGLTTAVDVYSLGAILYELLTGAPPFKAATPLDTILEVLEKEPVKPRAVVPSIDRDLETIVLKCLEKDSTRRYGSTEALADELGRWLGGEPILARPVSQLERTWRWCRRNPVTASLVAGVMIALIAGAVVSSAFAFEADRRADAETVARRDEAHQRQKTQKALEESEASLYANDIKLGYQYWQSGKIDQSTQTLTECPASLRNWEWHYLQHLNHSDLLTLRDNIFSTILLRFNRDGSRMASISLLNRASMSRWYGYQDMKNSATIWDLKTNKVLAEIFYDHGKGRMGISDGAFSSDGKTFAVIGVDGRINLFDAEHGQLIQELDQHAPGCISYADGKLKTVDVNFGDRLKNREGPRAITFSPDGKYVLCSQADFDALTHSYMLKQVAHLYDASTWKEMLNLGPFTSACFSGDGKLLALKDGLKEGHPIRVLETGSGKQVFSTALTNHFFSDSNEDVALSSDGQFLAAADAYVIHLWSIPQQKLLRTFRGHPGAINSVYFIDGGKRLVSCAFDNTIKIWDALSDQSFGVTANKPPFEVDHAIFSPDGRFIALVPKAEPSFFESRRKVILWDIVNGKAKITVSGFVGHTAGGIAYSADGRYLAAAGGGSGTLRIWDTETGRPSDFEQRKDASIIGAAFSPNGLLTASWYDVKIPESKGSILFRSAAEPSIPAELAGVVKIWNTETKQERHLLKGNNNVFQSAVFSPDGKVFATVANQKITLWDVESGNQQKILELPPGLLEKNSNNFTYFGDLLFSPDSKILVSAGIQAISVWDVPSGTLLRLLRGHEYGNCGGLAFTPDGQRLASAYETEIKIWNVSKGQELLSLPHPQFGTRAVAPLTRELVTIAALHFTPQGDRLYAVVRDGTILYWDASRTSQQPTSPEFQK